MGPSADPPAKRKAAITLELEPNEEDDATHARLDQEVLETIENDRSPMTLLATIVSTSERLDQKYGKNQNAKALLREHPGLVDKLEGAWQDKSFKEIRNLSTSSLSYRYWTVPNTSTEILRYHRPAESSKGTGSRNETPPEPEAKRCKQFDIHSLS
jgi:hypothetical protein